MNKLALTLFFLITCTCLRAQDTLPKFSVNYLGNNRVVVAWTNTFENIKQISIQRSFDSLKSFKTILTVPDATTQQNGYVDSKAPSNGMFYRLYIMLEKGVYLFSDSKRPVWDTTKRAAGATGNPSLNFPVIQNGSLPTGNGNNHIGKEAWVPSKYVYTYKDGYIRISLPQEDKKYSIKFFTDDDKPLFELKDLKERNFKIDKANFYHAGWFKFELYEDGVLKEKNKFYLPKEF